MKESMNANEPDYQSELENVRQNNSRIKLVLKDKGEYQGYIFRERESQRWYLVRPEKGIANTIGSQNIFFDIEEIESIQTIG
jgi:hypothetical protein